MESAHQRQALADGFPLQGLKKALPREGHDQLFKAVLEQLRKNDTIRIEGALASLADHAVTLNENQKRIIDEISSIYKSAGTAPPRPADVISAQNHTDAKKLFELLLARGELVRVAEDFFCHQDTITHLVVETRRRTGEEGFSVPEFKDWFGISRKFAIPLLEYLDSKGITYREGDIRKLTKKIE